MVHRVAKSRTRLSVPSSDKTRPDSPAPMLQGHCCRSTKRRHWLTLFYIMQFLYSMVWCMYFLFICCLSPSHRMKITIIKRFGLTCLLLNSKSLCQCSLLVQLLSRVRLLATPGTIVCQASLSFTISQSLPKLMFIELVMPSNHLILCHPLLLPPSIFPSIRVFSNELVFRIRCFALEFQLQH